MLDNKRFRLRQVNFQDLEIVIYDNLEDKQMRLSIYELVNLLNDFTQEEYDFFCLKKNIDELFDKYRG